MVAIPLYVKHNISFKDGSSGRLDISIGPKQTMGKSVSTANLTPIFVIRLKLICYCVSVWTWEKYDYKQTIQCFQYQLGGSSGSSNVLDYMSVGQAIDPAPGAWFKPKIISAQVVSSPV